jgi:hypothetical protein
MKRSRTEDNSSINKKLRDNKQQEQQPTDSHHCIPTPTQPDMSVLQYVHDLVQNLEQGKIDQCLSNSIDNNLLGQLNKSDSDLLSTLDLNLKKIAHRQLQLETENLRCRIMIQQQHQLFTSHGHEEKSTSQEQNHHFDSEKDEDEITTTCTTKSTTNTTNRSKLTPEDNLTSIRDSSLLDKLESSYRQMSALNELPSTGYFGMLFVHKKRKKKKDRKISSLPYHRKIK